MWLFHVVQNTGILILKNENNVKINLKGTVQFSLNSCRWNVDEMNQVSMGIWNYLFGKVSIYRLNMNLKGGRGGVGMTDIQMYTIVQFWQNIFSYNPGETAYISQQLCCICVPFILTYSLDAYLSLLNFMFTDGEAIRSFEHKSFVKVRDEIKTRKWALYIKPICCKMCYVYLCIKVF